MPIHFSRWLCWLTLSLLACLSINALSRRTSAASAPPTSAFACSFTVAPQTKTVAAAANSFSVSVDASQLICPWSSQSNANWLTVTPAVGPGSLNVAVVVSANTGPQRTGSVVMAGKTVTVTQASGCTFAINPATRSVVEAGGNFTLALTASNAACAWTASESSPWITLGQLNGAGSTNFAYAVFNNDGPARSTTLTLAGQTHTINQASGCTFTATPNSFDFTAASNNGVITMTPSANGCAFNANTLVPWIHINSTANGKITFSVDVNAGPARDGLISAGFNSINIHQRSGCDYDLTPGLANYPASGGAAGVSVAATSNQCQWTAVSDANWITLSNPGPHQGNKLVNYSVAANTGYLRSGSITIGARKLTITQASGCTFSVNQTSQSFAANGGNGSVPVAASGNDCPWTAVSNDNWITITGNANKQGTTNANFTVAPNNGPARTGSVTVAGKTVIVGQAAGCNFTINPATQNFSAAGGAGTVNITASNAACTYSSGNPPAWVSVNSGATGTGSGVLTFTVAANLGAPRSGSLQIAGQTLSLSQEAPALTAPVVASLSPGFTARGGGEFTLQVLGSNFTPNCRVRWNGVERATSYVSSTQLLASIPAADIAAEGQADISVFNVSASNGSNEKPFMIYGALANVSSASYTGATLAPNSMVSAFGSGLATQTQVANKQPLPMELAGTVVTIQDSQGQTLPAPLFFVSPLQVNYLLPEKVMSGPALVMVQSGDQHISVQFVQIAPVAPALFTANASGKGVATGLVLRIKANGQQLYDSFAQYDNVTGKFIAKPIDLYEPNEQVFLIFYGTGFRYRSALEAVTVEIGGLELKADYAGPVAGFEGLDQINLHIPITLAGRGELEVALKVDGNNANPVKLAFK